MHINSLVNVAENRGYLTIENESERVRYHHADASDYDYTDPEEKVRAYVYSWLVMEKDYPVDRIDTEVQVPRRTPSDLADIVVYESDDLDDPYLVVETKPQTCTGGDWEQAIEQGFGNANSLRTTTYMLVDRYDNSGLYDIQNYPPTERNKNRIGSRNRLPTSYDEDIDFRLIAGGSNDISPSPVQQLERKIRRAHAEIWSGGKRDPLTSFDEWSKLLFAKIYDERYTPNGNPRRFQEGVGESESQVANRIHETFADACDEDPSVFGNTQIDLPAEKVATIVTLLEEESFIGHDLDAIGRAFEEFFGQIFRGQLGQYFTRRELTRYIVGSLKPTSDDFILDPTVGSGGFLLEALFQVWADIDENYREENAERLKFDFARNHLHGIEIHETLARICKTNLLLHKDGHTNVEGDQSCLDTSFDNDRIDDEQFDMVLGNPPFGDQVEQGDTDRLGRNSLSNFELKQGTKMKTEIAITERAIQFLEPGGELGFVVPDGLLNNSGEQSNCPQFRRYLLRNGRILNITSLPDHTFTKAGAQNKTSILLFEKFTEDEKRRFGSSFSDTLDEDDINDIDDLTGTEKWQVLATVLEEHDHQVFLSEAEEIGYAPTGEAIDENDLYSLDDDGLPDDDDESTILGQYHQFRGQDSYDGSEDPETMSVSAAEMIGRRNDGRIDPKHHLFQQRSISAFPEDMTQIRLGNVLVERDSRVDPISHPDTEFIVPTITHDGHMKQREAGKHNNPIAWEGQYFSDGSTWHHLYEGDVVFSKIDLWKGAISIVGSEFDGGICTTEFPVYEVVDEDRIDRHYLKLLLRTQYFQDAIRSITTGHSNRRRTSKSDFEDLKIFVPVVEEQRKIAAEFENRRQRIEKAEEELDGLQASLDKAVTGEVSLEQLIEEETEETPKTQTQLSEVE